MWGLFYKVGQFIAKSGWYFKVNQLLQCGPCTMFMGHMILNVYCFTMFYIQNHGTEPNLLTL